ncbi:MAG: DUF456 domain-containing protein [Gemmatimonadota bacterium]
MDWLLVLLLVLVLFVGLILIPLGLPGLWVMLLAILGYGALTDFRSIGLGTLAVVTALAFIGEIIEWWVGFKYTQKYGGSRRAGWGALLGGIVGAFAGIPIPIIGSIIGSFLGSFAGAAIFQFTKTPDNAVRAGWGALLGRLWATAAKTSLGLVMAVIAVFAALRG